MKTTLILLAGRKGVGKSTAANFIKNTIPNNNKAVIKSFAGKLKEIASILGIPHELSTGTLEQKNSLTQFSWDSSSEYLRSKYPNKSGWMTVREVLQVLGTDVFRDCFNENVWVHSLMYDISMEICGPGGYVVNPGWQFLDNLYYLIDDCRLPNEVRNFNEYGFDRTIKIHIKRPSETQDAHKSETALDDLPEFSFDYIINNNGDLQDLYRKLSKILGDIS